MNNKVIVGIIVVVLIILGIYWFMKRDSTSNLENNSPTSQTSDKTSMKSLLASGDSVTCTFTSGESGFDSSGTIYVSGGKMKGDFTTSSGSTGKVESHMIVDNGTSYVWSSASSQGMKMKVDEMSTAPEGGQSAPIDYASSIGYKCQPWSPNSTSFAVPKGITFTDFSAMMKAGAGTGSASQCAACDSLTGSQKTDCRTALQCK